MALQLILKVRTHSKVFVFDATDSTDDAFANADTLAKLHGGVTEVYLQLAKAGSGRGAYTPLLRIPHGRFYAKRSNQGESSGWGGKAGEERIGGGGDGNQGIGGGGQREGIGNERRGNRGRNHGGGNGDDGGDDRGGWVVDIEGGRRPIDRRPNGLPEILLLVNAEVIGALQFLDIPGLSARARTLGVGSWAFTSVAVVFLSASIQQRGTNQRLASILSWMGSAATFLGFISLLATAFSASFAP